MCVKYAGHIENLGLEAHPQEKFLAEQHPPLVQLQHLGARSWEPRDPSFSSKSLFFKIIPKNMTFRKSQATFLSWASKGCGVVGGFHSWYWGWKLQTISAASDDWTMSVIWSSRDAWKENRGGGKPVGASARQRVDSRMGCVLPHLRCQRPPSGGFKQAPWNANHFLGIVCEGSPPTSLKKAKLPFYCLRGYSLSCM